MYKMLKQKGAKQNKPAKKIRKDQCLARTEAFLGCLPERGHFLGKLRTSSEIQRQSLLSWACVQRRGPTQANPFFFLRACTCSLGLPASPCGAGSCHACQRAATFLCATKKNAASN
jgi:hypothetical protein